MNTMEVILIIIIVVICLYLVVALVSCTKYRKRVRELETHISVEQENDNIIMRDTLSNITHDLKTPLTAIRGYSQGILDGVVDTPERINKYVTTIRNKADDMANLVDELSFFANIHKREIEYHRIDIEIQQFISACMGNLSLDLATKNIDFLYHNNTSSGTKVNIDVEKMKRVLYNIVGNSLKYIQSDKGLVYIEITEGRTHVWVHVSDNGKGIKKEELPMIFDKFYRTDESRNSTTGGSGLGLAIVKKVVEDHGGRVKVDSEIGQGTKISFSIPKI